MPRAIGGTSGGAGSGGQPAGPLHGAQHGPAPRFSPAPAFIDLPCLPGCIHADNQIALLPSSFFLKYH